MEYIQRGESIERVLLEEGTRGDFEKKIRSACKEKYVPLKVVPSKSLSTYTSSSNHQGVLAIISPIPYYEVSQILDQLYEQAQTPLILILDKITDVRNFGAIARSALGLGGHAILIPLKHSAPINEISIKTSAGALTQLPICRYASQLELVSTIKSYGLQVVASTISPQSVDLASVDLSLPTALVIGSEDNGVNSELLKISDTLYHIPQSQTIDSLNASVAAAISLYEVSRQRREKDGVNG